MTCAQTLAFTWLSGLRTRQHIKRPQFGLRHFDEDDDQIQTVPFLWVGTTYFFHENVGNARLAAAAVKKLRDKTSAKKANRAKGFSYIDELFQHQPCMDKPVTLVTYDMTGFLKQCLDRYVELAGGNVQFKKVSTPFQDDRIARPTKDDTEKKGILQPIASKILMKVLFAARMARFDLLRATQGLASRVTKWSVDCDQALFRLMCYIHTTVDRKMHGFVGDPSSRTRLWLFADSDHAGEHDSRSTSGCFLALIGPNTFYPLTAFSKKQTSTAMSSTEAEVIAANVALRAVGLPSSCLWEIIQSAGGGTENPTCTLTPSRTSDYWINDTVNGYIVRVHNKRRTQLFVPSNDDCPVRTEALSSTRYTVQLFSDGNINLKVSRICPNDPESQTDSAWTGKTYFFMRGAGEADLGIEAKEIRDNLTDFEYVGDERVGSEGVALMNNGSFEGIFLEDNQATIRILESGRSPAFRHTDKTQRVNLAWLAEQFRRKHYKLTHVSTELQAADILTKPFTNAEKWQGGLKLMNIASKLDVPGMPAAVSPRLEKSEARNTGGAPNRILVEVCCSHDSKLGDTSRRPAFGCHVIRITQDDDILSHATRKRVVDEVKHVRSIGNKGSIPVLLWASIPCTGGTAWSHINMNHDTAKEKVKRHRSIYKRIWSAFVDLVNSMEFAKPLIAIEWPRSCTYWDDKAVDKFVIRNNMTSVKFDGCAVGVKTTDGIPMKKPWTVKTNMHCLQNYLDGRVCSCAVQHAEGRGRNLKNTESYTYIMTDLIHKAFAYAVSVQEKVVQTRILVATMAEALPVEKALKTVRSAFDARNYKDVPLARVDYGSDYILHDGKVKAEVIPDELRVANREAWSDMFRDAATQSFIVKDVNSGVDLAKMSERTDALALAKNAMSSLTGAVGVLKEAPVEAFDILFCPGKPAVNYLFFGDSFNALVKDGARTDVGTIIKENKRTLFGHKHEVWSEMTWGKGLAESLDAAERAMLKLAERPEPRPYVIVISWSGNDVIGRNGYVDNPAALAGWATDSEAKRKAAMDIIERNARAVMTVRDRLRHIAYREDVVQVVLIVPRDFEAYGLSESYKTQMDGHARLLHGSAGITVLDPQTLISNTSRADRIHTDDTERNRRHYINFYVAAAKLGYCIGQINRFAGAMNWYLLEREYMDIDTSIPIVGATPQETGGPAVAKNPEDPFDNEVREKELEAINKIAAQEPRREVFLEAEKETNPLYPLDTIKEETKILQMMQPDIHAATVSGLNDVIDWSSSSDEENLVTVSLTPGSQPKASRPKGQAVEVAAVDPNDVGEDGQIKRSSLPKGKVITK